MKFTVFFLFWLTAFVATVLAWEKEDHEIFDLVSALEAAEGKGTTFYSWLGVPPTATTSKISKAYRKLSMQLHPDKNPGNKGIHQRFARLGVIATILRNRESRKRYDFFYKNGVPAWRGTGYYYSRFRPGIGTVLIFLTLFTSIMQLIAQRMTYRRDKERMERIVSQARAAAWGPKLTPGEGQRKVKVNLGARDEYGQERWMDLVVEGPHVYIPDPDGDIHLLDPEGIIYPTFTNTWFFSLVKAGISKALNRGNTKSAEQPNIKGYDVDDSDDGASTTASESERSSARESVKHGRGPQATVMAGGRRRKQPSRRK